MEVRETSAEVTDRNRLYISFCGIQTHTPMYAVRLSRGVLRKSYQRPRDPGSNLLIYVTPTTNSTVSAS